MSKAIVIIDIPTDYADEYKQWLIDGRLCYLEDGAWTFLKEVEYEVEPYREVIEDTLQLNLRVPSNEIVKAVENSVIDALYAQSPANTIPIEWIKKQIEKYATFEFHLDVDDIEARACLKYLLEDWEKENETS